MSDLTLVPSLKTDLSDYTPDSTATITASGFAAGGTITFEADVYASDGSIIDRVVWTAIDDATTDPTGSGQLTTSFAVLSNYGGATIHLSASETTTATSGTGTGSTILAAATVFTDSPVPGNPVPPANIAPPAAVIDLSSKSSPDGVDQGAVFSNHVSGVTGTGVFGTFVQVQQYGSNGTEQGYNYDNKGGVAPQFEENNDAPHNHALQLADIPLIYADGHVADGSESGATYRAFRLDINQSHDNPLLSMDALQIYQATSAELTNFDAPVQQGGTGTGFGADATLVYDLDAAGDVAVKLNANLSHGSGSGDIAVLIPNSDFTNQDPTSFVYLYSAFGQQNGQAAVGGFEEWGVKGGAATGPTPNAEVSIDKQVSGFADPTAHSGVNGGQWFDAGHLVTTPVPVILVGKTAYFNSAIANTSSGNSPTGSMVATVTDHQDTTNQDLANFTFGSPASVTVTLADGAGATSNVKTETVLSGLNQDTATVDGIETVPNSGTFNEVTASDVAAYYGATPGVNIEKLISVDNGATWYVTQDDANDTAATINAAIVHAGGTALNIAIGTPDVFAGQTVLLKAVLTNTTDDNGDNLGVAVTSITDQDITTNTALNNFTGVTSLGGEGGTGVASSTLKALGGTHTDTATVTGTVTDDFLNQATVADSDSASYTGHTLATGGLTAGFWAQHTYAWDGVAKDDNSTLVSQKVLSSGDVLNALPTHGVVNYGTSVVTNPSPVAAHIGVLLGDANADGSATAGEATLSLPWLAADLMVAGSTSTSSDARLILMQQAVAAQLNIDNHDVDPGFLSRATGSDLLGTAVKWLTGKLAFSDGNPVSALYNVDNGPTNGVLDSGKGTGFELNVSNTSYDANNKLDFVSTSSSDWSLVKNGSKTDGNFVVDHSSATGVLGGLYVEATGQDLKNALQAFNQGQLVTSADGSIIGWSSGGVITDTHTNDQDGMWKVLVDHGIGHTVAALV
jgi:hypothetical protein